MVPPHYGRAKKREATLPAKKADPGVSRLSLSRNNPTGQSAATEPAGCSCCYVLSSCSRELEPDLNHVYDWLAVRAACTSRLEPHLRDDLPDSHRQQRAGRVHHRERRHYRESLGIDVEANSDLALDVGHALGNARGGQLADESRPLRTSRLFRVVKARTVVADTGERRRDRQRIPNARGGVCSAQRNRIQARHHPTRQCGYGDFLVIGFRFRFLRGILLFRHAWLRRRASCRRVCCDGCWHVRRFACWGRELTDRVFRGNV